MEFELTAAMRAFMQSGGTDFEVNAEITQDWYSESSDDDVTDYSVGFSLDQSLTGQQQVSLSGDFSRSHEDRGAGLSQGGAGIGGNDAPVEFETTAVCRQLYPLRFWFCHRSVDLGCFQL